MFYLPQLEQIREKEQQMDIDEWKAYYEAQVEKTENFMEVSMFPNIDMHHAQF